MIALNALLRAVKDKLQVAGFGGGVHWEAAPQGTPFPYAIYLRTGGGDDNARAAKKTADITLQITCFSDDDEIAAAGAGAIDDLFDDAGEQEKASGYVDAAPYGWCITTVTAVGDVQTIERYENVAPIYQFGKEYQFIMEQM